MTRGNFVLITEDENGKHYYMSTEFNGDMYIDGGHGEDIIEKLSSGEITSLDEWKEYVGEFNKKNFQYNDEWLYGEIILDERNGKCKINHSVPCTECPHKHYNGGDCTCNNSLEFEGVTNLFDVSSYSYYSDYSYWLNLTNDDIEVLAKNGVVRIVSDGGAVFYYGEFLETELDSGFIDAEDSFDFEDQALIFKWIREDGLTEDEAKELSKTDIKDITAIYDSYEDFGKSCADSYGIDEWIQGYMDMERYGRDEATNIGCCYTLNSGRIVCSY